MQKIICDRCKEDVGEERWKLFKEGQTAREMMDICDKCVGEIKNEGEMREGMGKISGASQ